MSNEKTTFGATVEPVRTATDANTALLTPRNVFDTPTELTPTVTRDGQDHHPPNPFSSSPNSAPERCSLEKLEPVTKNHLDVFETDLESGRATPVSASPSPLASGLDLPTPYQIHSNFGSGYRLSSDARTRDCTMWPTKETLRENARKEEMKRRATRACGLGRVSDAWHGMDRKTRLWIKILLALFVVALAVGLGIGISKAVGGGVWAGSGHQSTIPNNS
ncbi:hypothetical protein H2203_001525 [Taxawa tesnikishii (nom. ined.)]|nr:hypothetical protein H2203_001525 [Dothideales sp. JES 119]